MGGAASEHGSGPERSLHLAVGVLAGVVGGPATYGQRLVRALAELRDAERLRITVLTDRTEAFADIPGCEVLHLPMSGGLDRLRWQYWALPRALRRLAPDVYHDTKNALPRGLPCAGVVTIHDLAYHVVPESFGWASRRFLARATAGAARRAQRLVVPSEATASDVRRFYPDAADKLRVALHGIDPPGELAAEDAATRRRALGLPARYVLHVGTIQARKNVDLVVRGVRQLREAGHPDLRAVVVGRTGWLADRALQEIAADDTALRLEYLDDQNLAAVYQGACAFVSPSAYEGFGFTVADALAHGVPTVIADRSSLPEVCGPAALRLRELSAEAVCRSLGELLENPEMAAQLAAAGRARAAEFTWDRAAAAHLLAYREAQQIHGS